MIEKKRIQKHIMIQIILFLILIALDQFSKHILAFHLQKQGDLPLLPGVLEFHYLENTGAAFGIFQGRKWLFLILTVIILGTVGYLYVRIWSDLFQHLSAAETGIRTYAGKQICISYGLSVLCAGAIGNLIDRMAHGYVIDFIHVLFLEFPVFNLADIYVTVSCIFIVLMFIFGKNKEDDSGI